MAIWPYSELVEAREREVHWSSQRPACPPRHVQGHLAHKKPPPPEDHHMGLGTARVQSAGQGDAGRKLDGQGNTRGAASCMCCARKLHWHVSREDALLRFPSSGLVNLFFSRKRGD